MMKFLPLLFIFLSAFLLRAQNPVVWTLAQSVASATYENQHPRIALDDAYQPLILWGHSDQKKAYFSRWTGNAFTQPVALNPANLPVFAASWAGPDLVSRGDTVYVVFKETPEDTHFSYLVASFDGGGTFSQPVQVDAFLADSISRFPTVAIDRSGNPLVGFMKFNSSFGEARYVVTRSTDFGQSFGPDVKASGFSGLNSHVCDCCPASMATSGDTVVLLYRDNRNNLRNSWAGVSTDGGSSFESGIQVDDKNWTVSSCPSSGPDGVIIGDSLYSVFMSKGSGTTLCYFSRASISSLQAAPSQALNTGIPGISLQNFPRIAHAGKAVAIVLRETVNGTGQLALFFSNDITSGAPFAHQVIATGNIENGDLAMSEGEIQVVWEDHDSGTVKYQIGGYTPTISTGDVSATPLTLYPNPGNGEEVTALLGKSLEGMARYSISNTEGRQVFSSLGKIENGKLRIETGDLKPGLYLVRARVGQQVFVGDLLRQ